MTTRPRVDAATARGTKGSFAARRAKVVISTFPATAAPRSPELQDAVRSTLEARAQQELATLRLQRLLGTLEDQRVGQRAIADLVGISQAEVSRRLARRSLWPADGSVRETVLARQAGQLSSPAMLQHLIEGTSRTRVPEGAATHDGAATSTGFGRDLMRALQDGLLDESEYEQVRAARAARAASRHG